MNKNSIDTVEISILQTGDLGNLNNEINLKEW